MSFESMLTFFFAIFIFSITPGPGVFALISNSLSNGFKSSIPLALGMTISDIVYLILAFYGLVSLAQNYAQIFDFIRIMGGIYLVYLGYKIFFSKSDDNIENEKKSYKSFIKNFLKGFFISASNPKVIIFYIAFLPTFVDINNLSRNDMIISSFITFFALMSGLLLISFWANKAKKALKSQKSIKILNRSAGSIMAGAGFYLLNE
ncbi:MAG: LysE family translocator [Campylobacteraceae bacterium]|nr:LysE family translocator [Campylobacteraceae bacterium]